MWLHGTTIFSRRLSFASSSIEPRTTTSVSVGVIYGIITIFSLFIRRTRVIQTASVFRGGQVPIGNPVSVNTGSIRSVVKHIGVVSNLEFTDEGKRSPRYLIQKLVSSTICKIHYQLKYSLLLFFWKQLLTAIHLNRVWVKVIFDCCPIFVNAVPPF